MFDRELQFFIANQDRLVADHLGKTLVLKGEQVVGVHDSPLEAYLEAIKRFEPGSFMIQPCAEGSDAYTVTITSHEIFGAAP